MKLFPTLAASAVLCGAALAAEVNVENIRPGKHIAGPDLSSSQMRGMVVLVEKWGTR